MDNYTYKTIEEKSEGVLKEKGSRFISLIYPVTSEEEVKQIMASIKKTYYNATHHCYAYTIGPVDSPLYRINDDGEPAGTAGRPIYGQLLSYELKDVLAVVIRYFGGTKLGVSGLINAYKTATQIAIENATIVEKSIKDKYEITFNYDLMNEVMRIIKKEYCTIYNMDFNNNQYIITFDVNRSKRDETIDLINNITHSQLLFIETL